MNAKMQHIQCLKEEQRRRLNFHFSLEGAFFEGNQTPAGPPSF